MATYGIISLLEDGRAIRPEALPLYFYIAGGDGNDEYRIAWYSDFRYLSRINGIFRNTQIKNAPG